MLHRATRKKLHFPLFISFVVDEKIEKVGPNPFIPDFSANTNDIKTGKSLFFRISIFNIYVKFQRLKIQLTNVLHDMLGFLLSPARMPSKTGAPSYPEGGFHPPITAAV